MGARHVPQRTCVICGTKTAKRELVRVVLTPDGECLIDETGKRSGRGAYVCGKQECRQQAMKGGRLARALRVEPTALRTEDKERLQESL